MKVGFIGLGKMGQGMSRRILGGGHDLLVYNRTREKASDLADAGAIIAPSLAEVCRRRDIVITMVSDDTAVKEVTLGAGGVRDSLAPGAVHLCMGTHSVAVIQALGAAHAQANQSMVCAPVLGRPDAAAAGQLGIVAAGPADAVQQCEPLFQVIGRRTFEAGAKQEGAAAIKLSNNFVLGAAIEAMSEAFSLVRKYGVLPQVLFDVMTDALFASPAYKIYGKIIVDESYDKAGFMTLQGLKDLNLVLAAADQARVPMPSANNVRDRLLGAIAHGDGDKDWAVMAREQNRACGIES
jgi:3-hydroxyisobutyrate dehydrogenase-like beta-hydroxyacid dehydrogenase